MKTCTHTNSQGNRGCSLEALPGKELCLFHQYPEAAASIISAIEEPDLFKSLFPDGLESWAGWISILKAIFKLPMDKAERKFFRQVTKRKSIPHEKNVSDILIIAGRQSGKSFISSLILVYLSLFRRRDTKNSNLTNVLLAGDRQQAEICFKYCQTILNSTEILKSQIKTSSKESITLKNGIQILIKTSNFRAVRGYACPIIVCDELAFWRDEKRGANPAEEILNALRPSQSNIRNPLLLKITSPYSKEGLVFREWEKGFGKDTEGKLVIQAPSQVLNPSISLDFIKEELKRDRIVAEAEYFAKFRDRSSQYLSSRKIAKAIMDSVDELSAEDNVRYLAFVDPSSGEGKDSMTLSISHYDKKTEKVIQNFLQQRSPPFDVGAVVTEFAMIMRQYNISECTGDRYSIGWIDREFLKHNIYYKFSEKNKSEIYREFAYLLSSKKVKILDDEVQISELKNLVRTESLPIDWTENRLL